MTIGSQPRLWLMFGQAWGWPAASMTYQHDAEDLARHEAEITAHQSFNYALFDNAETALLGCVYIDPPEKQGADAEICWWVVDEQAGTDLERALDALVPQWIAAAWPDPGWLAGGRMICGGLLLLVAFRPAWPRAQGLQAARPSVP